MLPKKILSNSLVAGSFVGLLVLQATPSFAVESSEKNKLYGFFPSDPQGKFIGPDHFELTKPFDYVDPYGAVWRVPAGFQTDGASIPWIFWSFIGAPFNGHYRYAAIVHDHFCRRKYYDWEIVHSNFYNGMRAKNVSKAKAWIMYQAVYEFGTECRWTRNVSDLPKECQPGNDYDPSKCIHSSVSGSGEKLAPRRVLNKENLELFLQKMNEEGYRSEVEELRQQRSIQDVLSLR